MPTTAPGAEGIVSFGGGVTAIAVHEVGVPRFVRVLGTGGRELTDAIANELDLPPETAEALKRQLGATGHDELVARARSSIERPLSVLLDEVRSSIDYYRNQAGLVAVAPHRHDRRRGPAPRPDRAAVGVGRRAGRAGATARARRPRRHRVHRRRAAAPRPVPPGGRRPRARRCRCRHGHRPAAARAPQRASKSRRPQIAPGAVAAVAAVVVLLGGVTFLAHQSVSSAKSQRASVTNQVTDVSSRARHACSRCSTARTRSPQIQSNLSTLLATDVSWKTMMNADHEQPSGRHHAHVVHRSGDAARSGRAGRAAGAGGHDRHRLGLELGHDDDHDGRRRRRRRRSRVPSRSQGTAKDYPTLAAWIDAMNKVPEIGNVYVTSAQKVAAGGRRCAAASPSRRPPCRRRPRRATG